MKQYVVLLFVLLFAYSVSGCSNGATASPTGALIVEDQASLLAALQAAGATVNVGDAVIQDFFSPEGQIITVNGADIQVFEYESAEVMESEAALVAPDGGSIGTSMVTWMDAPHFYKAGRMIVLYVGGDSAILDLLENVIGPQFAGQ
ncbi:MAG TPA: hypothetical protein VFR47_01145 [Anaerolineales bacterium]|nr:hypothetical protein [Anaerolineales bacterium]